MVLAMTAFPEAQKKAQAELDRVVGPHRLPTLDDLPDLPYVQAIIQEVSCVALQVKNRSLTDMQTHRFRPVAPLMIPHATIALEEVRDIRLHQARETPLILFISTKAT